MNERSKREMDGSGLEREVALLSMEGDFIGSQDDRAGSSWSSSLGRSSSSQSLGSDPVVIVGEQSDCESTIGRGRYLTNSFKKRDSRGNLVGLGTLEGVFVPCVSSIIGAVLFVRLSWSVGQVGWGGALLMLAVGTFVNMMTALSIAAMSTNGSMKGGGAYFIISRSIGPELGVATGIIFAISLCLSATFSITAFGETFVDSILCDREPCGQYHVENRWLVAGMSSIALLVLLVFNLVFGGSFMFRFGNLISGLMMLSIGLGVLSLLFSNGAAHVSFDNLRENFWFQFAEVGTEAKPSFLSVFVIVFPMMTGITSGASMSGKLKDPAKSIGPGTIGAIAFTTGLYIFLIFVFALSVDRATLQGNKTIFEDACFVPPVIVLGIMSCTLSSALGYLSNAAGLLQALARDDLLSIFTFLGQGSARDDEPQLALLLCWFLVQLGLLYGKLDSIAGMVTDFFLLVYFFLNISCFALRISGAPNFRPRFAYFSWHTALAGAISSLVLIFVFSPLQGLVALTVTVMFAYYVHVSAPIVPWGDVSQALIYHQVRKYLLRLDVRRSHPKFWRPSILLVPEYERGQLALIDFCNNLKKGGLYVIGNVLVSPPNRKTRVARSMPNTALVCARLKQLWIDLLDETNCKGFYEETVAPTLVAGFRSLLMSAGLGGLKPNTVCVQFFTERTKSNNMQSRASPSAYRSNAIYDEGQLSSSNGGDGGSASDNNSLSTLSFRSAGFNHLFNPSQQYQERKQAYTSLGNLKSVEIMGEIQQLMGQFQAEPRTLEHQEMDYCEMLADVLVMEKNLLIAQHFEELDKEVILDYRKRRKKAGSSKNFLFTAPYVFRFKTRSTDPYSGSGVGQEFDDMDGGAGTLNRYTTIDLWSTDERDWNDPSGTLALQMQLAFGLHRTDIWERAKLRVIAACQSVTGAKGSEQARSTAHKAYLALKKLLTVIRVEAEIVVLPAVGAALFEEYEVDDNSSLNEDTDDDEEEEQGRQEQNNMIDNGDSNTEKEQPKMQTRKRCPIREPLTETEIAAELNSMVIEYSSDRACVVFLPLPKPPSHSRITPESASNYLENLRVLTQGLPPCMLCCPGSNISPLVTTEL